MPQDLTALLATEDLPDSPDRKARRDLPDLRESVDLTASPELLARLALLDPSAILANLAREAKMDRMDPLVLPDPPAPWDPPVIPAMLDLLVTVAVTETQVCLGAQVRRDHVVCLDLPVNPDSKDNRDLPATLDLPGQLASVEREANVDLADRLEPQDLLVLREPKVNKVLLDGEEDLALRETKDSPACPDPMDFPDHLAVLVNLDNPDSVDHQDLLEVLDSVDLPDALVRAAQLDDPATLDHVGLLVTMDPLDLPAPRDPPDLLDHPDTRQPSPEASPGASPRAQILTCNTTSLWILSRSTRV